MKYILPFLVLILSSCTNFKIVRNYKFSPEPNCDCLVKSKATIGKMNVQKENVVVYCNNSDFNLYADSIDVLNDSLYRSEDLISDEEIKALEMKIDSLQAELLQFKMHIKTKKVFLSRELSEYQLKRKTKYLLKDGKRRRHLKTVVEKVDTNFTNVKTKI